MVRSTIGDIQLYFCTIDVFLDFVVSSKHCTAHTNPNSDLHPTYIIFIIIDGK